LRGPGPGRYKLPSTFGHHGHDFTKNQKPAFSFGKRFNDKEMIASPGPVYRVTAEITRHGHEGSPKYTQLGRRRESRAFKTPGPGRYENHTCHPQGEVYAPKHSMGSRTKYRKCDAYPSANSYSLPTLIGPRIPTRQASNAYSMTARRNVGSFDQDLANTPGAARYVVVDQNNFKKQSPKYSMLARRFVPGDKTRKPGPGAHYPEHVSINKQSVPHYSMGIRHSEYITPFI
jgi:hypothetical protein